MSVELRIAFEWDCPECGELNFTSSVPAELNADERQEVAEALGGNMVEAWAVAPDEVECDLCGGSFLVRGDDGDEDDEDDEVERNGTS